VTVKLDVEIGKNMRTAKIVSPKEPRKTGIYWGYNVRRVNSITHIFSGSQYENG
jgi:predicted SPOUT superfamily RNA methylase MTH1